MDNKNQNIGILACVSQLICIQHAYIPVHQLIFKLCEFLEIIVNEAKVMACPCFRLKRAFPTVPIDLFRVGSLPYKCFNTTLRVEKTISNMSDGILLQDVVKRLGEFACTKLAEKWDNVGLLVEPSGSHKVKKILLTNDLTQAVLEEAVQKSVNMIISYHPPIFVPLKRLSQGNWKERIITKCIEKRIAIYSPHTSYDAIKGGVNDWLVQCFGPGDVKPIIQSFDTSITAEKPNACFKLRFRISHSVPDDYFMPLMSQLESMPEVLRAESWRDPAR